MDDRVLNRILSVGVGVAKLFVQQCLLQHPDNMLYDHARFFRPGCGQLQQDVGSVHVFMAESSQQALHLRRGGCGGGVWTGAVVQLQNSPTLQKHSTELMEHGLVHIIQHTIILGYICS